MLRNWLEPQAHTIPDEFIQAIGGNPLISQVLWMRGLRDIYSARGFMYPEVYIPAQPAELPGLEQAAVLVKKAISENKKIGVWGDFDVDGQTSTAILVSSLRQMGANVVYHIPVRLTESHGITIPALDQFLLHGIELLLTCDTGISAHEAVEYARRSGTQVIITDHHDLPEILPQAEAIIDPKFLPAEHPLSSLPGVGVAYKLVEYLWQMGGNEAEAQQFLDLVGLGIVADIALLKGDTRYLLQLGLEALRHTTRSGLLSMFELTELNQANITEEHIGFILAPRMNSLGRLEDANRMVEFLTTDDMGRARVIALELEGFNAQRKLLSNQVYQAAQAQISTTPKLLDYSALVLSHPNWPAGVIGVVAARLAEQYHRPVILFSAPTGGIAHGSARSIDGINITAAITANKNLVRNFGGHPMAAGLGIDTDRIPDFRQALSDTVQAMGVGIEREKSMQIDGYLALPDLSLSLVEDFERLAPFGAGNPPIVLATRNLNLVGYSTIGRTDEHLQLTLEDELGHTQRSIWWQGAGNALPDTDTLFDLAYSVRASTYHGQSDVQIEWIDFRQVDDPSKSPTLIKQPLVMLDYRNEPDPIATLHQLGDLEPLVVWGEVTSLPALDRESLSRSKTLAILTIPPGPAEIQAAIEKVKPETIILFAIDPCMDHAETFLKRLIGLVKYQVPVTHGVVRLTTLAAATSHRTATVKAALEWLDENGHIHLVSMERDKVGIEIGGTKKEPTNPLISTRLNALLRETAAFRRYYLTADKDRLASDD